VLVDHEQLIHNKIWSSTLSYSSTARTMANKQPVQMGA
ncbi:unnamed protein product, partial [Rotaria magnacalcarata]